MSNQVILQKAIHKAIDGGWLPNFTEKQYSLDIGLNVRKPLLTHDASWTASTVVFSHDFAKALWGEELIQYPEDDPHSVTAVMNRTYERSDELWVWQFHLQQMVIAEDPIKYLGEHL